MAKLLFSYENPPGTTVISGSQDALGIVLPGLNRLWYREGYWPDKIDSIHNEEILSWLQSHLSLVTLGPRAAEFSVTDETRIDAVGNVIDRLLHGHVVDFIQVHYAGWYFPSFNVADSAISVGAALLIVDEILRVRRAR